MYGHPMRPPKKGASAALLVAVALSLSAPNAIAQAPPTDAPSTSVNRPGRFSGMDDSVNVDLAKKAGVPARKPYINVEEWGDLWNLILLLGGGICGFVIGRYWDHIWGRRRAA
jgi:hypothetical protein